METAVTLSVAESKLIVAAESKAVGMNATEKRRLSGHRIAGQP
jgi:hypothetical protein